MQPPPPPPLQQRHLPFAEAQSLQRLQSTNALKKRVREGGGVPAIASSSSTSSTRPSSSAPRGAGGKKGGGASFSAMIGAAPLSLAEAAASLARRSVHAEEGADAVLAGVLARTDAAEKVEAMEARMMDVDSREVTRWFCMDCDTWFTRSPTMCNADGHDVHAKRKTEWRFECNGCGTRAFHDREVCVAPCTKCGKSLWSKTSVFNVPRRSDGLAGAPALQTHGEPVAESLRTMGAHQH